MLKIPRDTFLHKYINLDYKFCCGRSNFFKDNQITHPPDSKVPKGSFESEFATLACPTTKSSLLILKYSDWPKPEFCRPQ